MVGLLYVICVVHICRSCNPFLEKALKVAGELIERMSGPKEID